MYYVKRIGQAIITMAVVTTLAFVLYRMMPGGPVQNLVALRVESCMAAGGSPAECDPQTIRQQVESSMNIDPDKPVIQAYVDYMANVFVHQDFGRSTQHNRPVFDILFEAMPWSIFISMYGLALGWTFNIFWGAAMAYKEGSRFDMAATTFSMAGNSVPYYVAAILALAFFSYELGWFPTGGRVGRQFALHFPIVGTIKQWQIVDSSIPCTFDGCVHPGFNVPYVLSMFHHAALPTFTGFVLGINGLGMRGNAIRVMESDYIQVARLRGLSGTRIASRYLARNSVLPLYTSFMIGIATIFSSGVIMEYIFTYPAVGWYTFGAIEARDYPLLMGSFILYTAITLAGITIADFTYGFIDPRAGQGGNNESY